MLVSVEQLRAHLNDARWCVVDVRHDLFDAEAGIRAYRAGHIPGAVFADIDTQLSGKKTGLQRPASPAAPGRSGRDISRLGHQ